MNCFNHQTVSAIGNCKACAKGLCIDCATDLGHGLACKGLHEERVNDLEMIISKNATAFKDASKNIYIMPVFYLFMGLVFCGYSIYNGGSITEFSFVMGAGFIVFGTILLVRNRKIFSDKTSTSNKTK